MWNLLWAVGGSQSGSILCIFRLLKDGSASPRSQPQGGSNYD